MFDELTLSSPRARVLSSLLNQVLTLVSFIKDVSVSLCSLEILRSVASVCPQLLSIDKSLVDTTIERLCSAGSNQLSLILLNPKSEWVKANEKVGQKEDAWADRSIQHMGFLNGQHC